MNKEVEEYVDAMLNNLKELQEESPELTRIIAFAYNFIEGFAFHNGYKKQG